MLLDIRKAYDTVWRDAIIYKLRKKFDVPDYICKTVYAMLENTYSGIKKDNKYSSKMFPTKAGVVQGSVISPILYGVSINDLLTELSQSNCGTKVQDEHIAVLAYCDDLILLSNTKQNLLKLSQICQRHSYKWKYKFNPSKCHIISQGAEQSLKKKYLTLK